MQNIRRIDDLGRVAIPKEIRRIAGICEGDPLEIALSDDGSIIIRKYAPVQEKVAQPEAFKKPKQDAATLNSYYATIAQK